MVKFVFKSGDQFRFKGFGQKKTFVEELFGRKKKRLKTFFQLRNLIKFESRKWSKSSLDSLPVKNSPGQKFILKRSNFAKDLILE
jgi:hypothetical protein